MPRHADEPRTLPERIGEVEIDRKLGEGGRSVVYAGRWRGREVALKVYKLEAVERHARRHPLDIAEFEYRRNLALFEVPGLARYIAEPLGRELTPERRALIQERLDGALFYFWFRERGATRIDPAFRAHLRRIVDLAHGAGLYDVDIHAFNVIVDESGPEPIPRLFDFNLIPFHERAHNPLLRWLVRLGLMSKSARDERLLRRFARDARRERKLAGYFEESS